MWSIIKPETKKKWQKIRANATSYIIQRIVEKWEKAIEVEVGQHDIKNEIWSHRSEQYTEHPEYATCCEYVYNVLYQEERLTLKVTLWQNHMTLGLT